MQVAAINEWKIDLKIRLHEDLRGYEHYLQVEAMLQLDRNTLKFKNYALTKDGTLQFQDRIYVPSENNLKKIILQ